VQSRISALKINRDDTQAARNVTVPGRRLEQRGFERSVDQTKVGLKSEAH
jgi:hypothetical protein